MTPTMTPTMTDEPMTYTAQTQAEHYEERLAQLQARLDTAREEAERVRADHRDDIARIGDALIDEADSRGWCEEYDYFVERLNRSLDVELRLRERSFTVEVHARVVISVKATDEDGARAAARRIACDVESTVDSCEGVDTSNWDDSYEYEVTLD